MEFYLGGDVGTAKIDDKATYALEDFTYIKNMSDNIKNILDATIKNYESTGEEGYYLKVDPYYLLVGYDVSRYRIIMGYDSWVVIHGRFDFNFNVSTRER